MRYVYSNGVHQHRFEELGLGVLPIGCPGLSEQLVKNRYHFSFSTSSFSQTRFKLRGGNLLCVPQIHPFSWDSNSFSEFEKMISYFLEQGFKFMTPEEYFIHFSPSEKELNYERAYKNMTIPLHNEDHHP